MRIHSRLTTLAAALLASAALAAPAVAQQDLRSPDTRDAAAQTSQDLRSPDARDAATGPRTAPTFIVTPAPQAVVETSSGFDWGSAAIGAAAILGLLAIGAGGVLVLRRHHDTTPPAGIVGV